MAPDDQLGLDVKLQSGQRPRRLHEQIRLLEGAKDICDPTTLTPKLIRALTRARDQPNASFSTVSPGSPRDSRLARLVGHAIQVDVKEGAGDPRCLIRRAEVRGRLPV